MFTLHISQQTGAAEIVKATLDGSDGAPPLYAMIVRAILPASQGWCPGIIDTNGNGKIDLGWTEPNEPIDPTRDHRIAFGAYSTTINPKDGSLWHLPPQNRE